MPIKLIFPDGEMEFETKVDAQRMIRRKLGVARCTAHRYIKDGITDFSKFYRNRTSWNVCSVILEGEVEARELSAPEIIELLEEMGHIVSRKDRQRIYRRIKKLNGKAVSISELTSAPLSPALAGRMGSAVSAEMALKFDGVEGYAKPVTASQLRRDWKIKLSLGAIYARLKGGLRSRRDLLQPRWNRVIQGRRRGSSRPTAKPKADTVKQVQPRPEISAEEVAAFKQSATRELPPMRDYTPPKPGYRRGT